MKHFGFAILDFGLGKGTHERYHWQVFGSMLVLIVIPGRAGDDPRFRGNENCGGGRYLR